MRHWGDTDDDPPEPTRPPLAATVIEFDEGPDRVTVYPSSVSGHTRVTNWLSADMTVVVDLEHMR